MLYDQNFLNVKKNGGGVGIGMGKITTTQALTTWSVQSNGRHRHIKSVSRECKHTRAGKCEERDDLPGTGGRRDAHLCSLLCVCVGVCVCARARVQSLSPVRLLRPHGLQLCTASSVQGFSRQDVLQGRIKRLRGEPEAHEEWVPGLLVLLTKNLSRDEKQKEIFKKSRSRCSRRRGDKTVRFCKQQRKCGERDLLHASWKQMMLTPHMAATSTTASMRLCRAVTWRVKQRA